MALKFLNKKGWHTGSLRNIENVWKAEQKHEAEQKKLEELRKQIQEEKERSEFRQLQEQAGLVPRQERLEFLYDSGLSVGRTSGSDGVFKVLEALPSQPNNEITASSSSSAATKQESVPGALFEEKPHSANDAWRKLHSDPLLMIRQREQEALARIKNNPVKMAMIRKSVEAKKDDKIVKDGKQNSKRMKHKKHSSSKYRSDSEDDGTMGREERNKEAKKRKSNHHGHHRHSRKELLDGEEENPDERRARHRDSHGKDSMDQRHRHSSPVESRRDGEGNGYDRQTKKHHKKSRPEGHCQTGHSVNSNQDNDSRYSTGTKNGHDLGPQPRRRNTAPKLSEEERAVRLREMQQDAELHEEQRWKRLKKAEVDDAKEATRSVMSAGKSFLDAAQKSVYGAEKGGGGASIEESIRRRSHYLQGRASTEGNAFRR